MPEPLPGVRYYWNGALAEPGLHDEVYIATNGLVYALLGGRFINAQEEVVFGTSAGEPTMRYVGYFNFAPETEEPIVKGLAFGSANGSDLVRCPMSIRYLDGDEQTEPPNASNTGTCNVVPGRFAAENLRPGELYPIVLTYVFDCEVTTFKSQCTAFMAAEGDLFSQNVKLINVLKGEEAAMDGIALLTGTYHVPPQGEAEAISP